MASDNPPEDAPAKVPISTPADWGRSPLFRAIHSNVYRFRPGAGEITITLCDIIDGFAGKAPNIIQDEISVTMSWQQMKMFADTLNMMISVIEGLTGEIKIPDLHMAGRAKEREGFLKRISILYPAKVETEENK